MCGIVGIVHYRDGARPVEPTLLRAMTASLAHRGPDGEGTWSAPGIGLGHRRLAILDPSDAGRQPMADPTGRFVISYNGEIYNFRELRDELERAGHRFRSRGDTEVLLAAYAEWGQALLERISGIFAFAIWDAGRREAFLARDPLGVKPLFVCEHGGTLRFASEIKAILTDRDVPRDPDPAAIDAFFTLSYVPAPSTGFIAVRQLLPGHAATVGPGGYRAWRYWRVPWSPRASDVSFNDAIARFDETFDRVTRAQMVSDVGIGAFLSGGLDSAAVVRSMSRARPSGIKAFCIALGGSGFDESERARATARSLGVSLVERSVRADAVGLLPALARHLEEPTADSSALPVFLLCREAASELKVAMSGDGADELLAGYETYRASALAARYRRLPSILRRAAAALARSIPASDRKYGLHQRATRFTYAAELGAGRDHAAWRIMLTEPLKQRVYAPEFLERVRDDDAIGLYARHVDDVPGGREPLAGLLNADLAFYLPNDMLVKLDRMSMAHGLEVRVPFLDVELVELCVNLPADHKLHRGRVRKHLLRETLRGSIPGAVLDAPKSGFNVPVEAWMRGPLESLLADVLESARPDLEGFLRPAAIAALVDEHRARRADHGHALFTLLMFGLWLDNAARAWRAAPRTGAGTPPAGPTA